MHVNAIDQALEGYASDKTEVELTLKDGSVVRGVIKNFDGYVIFTDGGGSQMVYRHSLLKIAPAMAARVPDAQAQPAERPRRERFQTKPDDRRNVQPQKSNRPPKPRPQERRPQPQPQEESGHMGTMGEAMLEWLKSQKG